MKKEEAYDKIDTQNKKPRHLAMGGAEARSRSLGSETSCKHIGW